jgi:hypothetical protein
VVTVFIANKQPYKPSNGYTKSIGTDPYINIIAEQGNLVNRLRQATL